ncbi:MAG: transcriptional regulator [Hyphomicrobiales bacterium]|nr:transcriptional regulator [Hyphomicrobiales bacterium]
MLLRQLRYFLAVAEAGSFTAAARRLHVSQPALGYQVKQLEEQFGVALLERHSRGIVATQAGAVLAAHARRVLVEVEATEQALDGFRIAPAGSVSLGVTPTPGRALAPDLVAAATVRPGPRIALREGLSDELARLVATGELDAALCYDPVGTERLDTLPLYTEDIYLVGPPHLMGNISQDVGFDDLARLPLVLDGRFQAGRRLIETIAQAQGTPLDLIEAEAVTVKRELLVRHGRCSIVPLGLFYEEISRGQLTARRVVSPTISRTLVLVTRRGLARETAKALKSAIVPLVAQRIDAAELAWRQPSA